MTGYKRSQITYYETLIIDYQWIGLYIVLFLSAHSSENIIITTATLLPHPQTSYHFISIGHKRNLRQYFKLYPGQLK